MKIHNKLCYEFLESKMEIALPMESALPNELVVEILSYLNDSQVYRYSLCSKTCRRSSECLWWKKILHLFGGAKSFYDNNWKNGCIYSNVTKFMYELQIHQSFSYVYAREKRIRINQTLRNHYSIGLDFSKTKRSKIEAIYKMVEYVIDNIEFIRCSKTFQKFIKTMEEKLFELCQDDEFWIKGEYYYSVLFPEMFEEKFYPWSSAFTKLFV